MKLQLIIFGVLFILFEFYMSKFNLCRIFYSSVFLQAKCLRSNCTSRYLKYNTIMRDNNSTNTVIQQILFTKQQNVKEHSNKTYAMDATEANGKINKLVQGGKRHNTLFTAEFMSCDRSTITRKKLTREIYAKTGIETD